MDINWSRFTDDQLVTIRKLAKSKLYAFYRDPHEMIALREECERRGIK